MQGKKKQCKLKKEGVISCFYQEKNNKDSFACPKHIRLFVAVVVVVVLSVSRPRKEYIDTRFAICLGKQHFIHTRLNMELCQTKSLPKNKENSKGSLSCISQTNKNYR